MSRRRGRLGFGALADADPIRDPARDPASDAAATLPPDTPAAPNQASKLAAQLARLREVSKRRPKADPAADGPSGLPAAAALTKPGDGVIGGADHGGPAPAEPGPRASVDATLTAPAPRPVPPTTRPSAADAVFTAGLLARKPTAAPGPSMRTGMILTLALLVLLILIALWSVFFLPQSPMARLFGSGGGSSPADVAEATPMPPAAVAGLMGDKAPEPDPEALADAGEADLADTLAASPPLPALAAAEGALPDIDADLDLPPLPQPPEVVLPSLEDTERIYAQDGIWPRPPDPPSFSPFALSDDIYIASIDPDITALDAVALADPRINIAEILRRVPPPPPFGAQLERDARGLIAATPEGVLTPEGAFVVLGRPSVVAPPRPREVATADLALAAPETPAVPVVDAALASFVPRPRPGDLVETRERQLLGGLTVQELSGRRPEPRPLSAQDAAARASLFPGAGDSGNAAPAGAAVAVSERAVASSRVPRLRPATIADMVAEATRGGAQITAAAATTIAPPPSIPTNADVARVATARNEIRLRDINLIGVTGTPSNRSALVRLPSGRFVRVSVGDTLDGGRVAAIGESSLQYVVNGQNVTLDIPG